MNEQTIHYLKVNDSSLPTLESIITIKKENLLLLAHFLPKINWLQQISIAIKNFGKGEFIIRADKNLKRIRIVARLEQFELFLSSEEQIDQLILLCKTLNKISHLLEQSPDDTLNALFFNQLFIEALNASKLELLSDIFSSLPSKLTEMQGQEIQDRLNAFNRLSIFPRQELLEISLLITARNFLVPSDQKIAIINFLCDLLSQDKMIDEYSIKEVSAKIYLDCLTLFSEAAQVVGIFTSKSIKDESLKQQVLNLFAGFIVKKFPLDNETVLIDEDEAILNALSLLNKKKWGVLLKDHPLIQDWLDACFIWRNGRKAIELDFSFYYQDGILVLFSQQHLQPRIINLLPDNPQSQEIFNFLIITDQANTQYDQMFENLHRLDINFLNKTLITLFNHLFFGEAIRFEEYAEHFVKELGLFVGSNKPKPINSQIQQFLTKINPYLPEEDVPYPPQSYFVSKKELFRIQYFFRLAGLVYPRDDYAPLLEKIEKIPFEKIKVTIQIENNTTDIIVAINDQEILGKIVYTASLPGMFKTLETLCATLPSNFGRETLGIYWQYVLVMKVLDIERYLKMQMILSLTLKGLKGVSLSEIIQTVLNEWKQNANILINYLVEKALSHEKICMLLNLELFLALDPRSQLEHLYKVVLESGSLSDLNLPIEDFTIIPIHNPNPIEDNPHTFWEQKPLSSFEHKVILSRNQLEVACYLLPENDLGKLILKSLQNGSFPISIKKTILIDRCEDGFLEFSSSGNELVIHLCNLRNAILKDENTLYIMRKAMDILALAEFISQSDEKLNNNTLMKLKPLIQQVIDTPLNINLSTIEQIEKYSYLLFKILEVEYIEKKSNIVMNYPLDPFAMDALFSFLAGKSRNAFNSQFKIINLPYSIERWFTIINQFTQNPILQHPSLQDWPFLNQFCNQIYQLQTAPKACITFINTLTLWNDVEEPNCVSVIELEEPSNPIDAMYMKFCKKAYYYASVCPKFIDALLVIHELPDLSDEEKIQYFNLFLNRDVGANHPLLSKLTSLYEATFSDENMLFINI